MKPIKFNNNEIKLFKTFLEELISEREGQMEINKNFINKWKIKGYTDHPVYSHAIEIQEKWNNDIKTLSFMIYKLTH